MNKVYLHKRMARDEYLGRVEADGDIYESRFGPDKKIGRVDLRNGQIYESRVGPDHHVGRVDLQTGKVYLTRVGPDEYLGEVHPDGKIYHHKRLSPDEYMGRVLDMASLAHGGGAFLLLVEPAKRAEEAETKEEDEALDDILGDEGEPGAAPAQA